MRLSWTANGIPHGFLCETPVHVIYRLKNCAPVGQLRTLFDDLESQLADLKKEGSVAEHQLAILLAEQMEIYDDLLDAQDQSKFILTDPSVAQVVIDSWKTLRDRQEIRLYAVCVMGNHVHALLAGVSGAADVPIGYTLRRHKTFTSLQAREYLSLGEDIWDTGYFDRYLRPGTFWEVLFYILNNPRKAGLVGHWREWRGIWVDERCLQSARLRRVQL